jgi:hypothetical protein
MVALSPDRHPWSPCISFLTKLAQLNGNIYHAILDARFIEMILWVSGSQMQRRISDRILEDACSQAFALLSEPPPHDLCVLWVEEAFGLCSNHPENSLVGVRNHITVQHLWPAVEARLLGMHAEAMLQMMLNHRQLARRELEITYDIFYTVIWTYASELSGYL